MDNCSSTIKNPEVQELNAEKTEDRGKERDSWSKNDEVWQRVNAILNAGVLASVAEKQNETRKFLEDVEERFNDIIKKAKIECETENTDLPDTAAFLPQSNKVSLEIHNALGAINMINDKQLKFRLTAFVDDYRRILEMNREQETQEIVDSLEEHFDEGSYDFIEQKEETDEMLASMAMVEEEAKKAREMKEELISRTKRLKDERDKALQYNSLDLLKETTSSHVNKGISFTSSDKAGKTPVEQALSTIYEILQRPKVMEAIGVDDFILLRQSIDCIVFRRQEARKQSTSNTNAVKESESTLKT